MNNLAELWLDNARAVMDRIQKTQLGPIRLAAEAMADSIAAGHQDKVGPVSTIAFVTCVWMTICTVAELLVARGVKLHIHPSHNVPGDTTAHQRLDAALAEYKRRIAGV